MENHASFVARLEPELAPSDVLRVRSAYYITKFGHRAQFRKEKDEAGKQLRYFEHLRRVFLILWDLVGCRDADLLCAAFLHDALEDTKDLDAALLEHLFGASVVRRVRLLSKVPKEGYLVRLQNADKETILIKACDRLDNLRSLGQTAPEFRQKQVKETLEKYLPLFTARLGGDHVLVREICQTLGSVVSM